MQNLKTSTTLSFSVARSNYKLVRNRLISLHQHTTGSIAVPCLFSHPQQLISVSVTFTNHHYCNIARKLIIGYTQ